MNAVLLKYQLIACGALGAVLFAEWGLGELGESRLQKTMNSQVNSQYQAEDLPGLVMRKHDEDNFDDLVERPLFIQGREPIPAADVENAESEVDVGQLEDWELIGIYNRDEQQIALFRKQNEAKKYLKLNEHQAVSGWQLEQIQADRVMFTLGGQKKTVMLTKPRTPAPAAAHSRPPLGRRLPPANSPNNKSSEKNK